MKKYLIFTLLLLLTSLSAATTPKAVYAKMQGLYGGISSFQSGVRQTNYYSQLKKNIVFDGKLYFTPGRMLMHFTKPQIQRLQIENGKLTLFDGMSNTILKSRVQPEFGKMNPVEVLQLYWNKSRVSITKEDKTTVSVSLIPSADPMLKSLSAVIIKSSGLVQSLAYADRSGNSVSYVFSGIKLNQGLPSGIWSFSYPKTAQILQQ
ncbi:MAG TPA: outer membrane lipoprotein carrier protein LolA [Candidatus Cloacimonadota bacterium]|nr:outer membrane lipoprotein carrier protein LolA [Candidatus Cloacimonadota bacterium]